MGHKAGQPDHIGVIWLRFRQRRQLKEADMLRRFKTALRALLRRAKAERELDDELRYHVEQQTEQNIRLGMNPVEARCAARMAFGGLEQAKEQSRDARGVRWIEDMWHDLRYGMRTLLKNSGFTLIVVTTLALGIGANTAIFTVVNAVLLRPLPYPEADRLVQIMRSAWFGQSEAVSASTFLYWQQHNQVFEAIAAFDLLGTGFSLSSGGEPEHVSRLRVSADYFRVFGAAPALGRSFTSEEDRPGGASVAVISNNLWLRRFGGDHSIIGKTISLSGEPYTVVGVMPPGFVCRPSADIWVPLRPVFKSLDDAGAQFVALARLKPGASLKHAQVDMKRVSQQLGKEFPDLIVKEETATVVSYHKHLVGDIRPALLILLGAVGFVLLITCANVANLLLARATARNKEMAIRAALGAGRLRLVRQLLIESTMLALAGGACGLLLSSWGLKGLLALTPGSLPQFSEVGIDARVLTLTLLIALITGILFGLVPALQTAKIDLNNSLLDGSGRTTVSARRARLRNVLILVEISLSLVLLVGAALLTRTFVNLRGVNPGFDPRNVLTMKLSLTEAKYDTTQAVWNLFQQVVARAEALPGVEAAAFVTNLPMEQGTDQPFKIEGEDKVYVGSEFRAITPNYFRAMSIPLRQGRYFLDADYTQSAGVVIINEALARKYFPSRNPIGRHLFITSGIVAFRPREVIGIVGDVREFGLDNPAQPTLFIPAAHISDSATPLFNKIFPASFVMRTKVAPMSLKTALQKEVLAVDGMKSLFNVRPLEELLADSLVRRQFAMLLLSIFAVIALFLASVGIYGVMSYSVSQRTHEIGIRVALGAQTSDVLWLVIREGIKLALFGVLIGVSGAWALTRLMKTLLFGVSATDPTTFAVIALFLIGVVLLACYLPARRATEVDPLVALRCD
jgi:putative ABC transport system permease protein